MGDTTHCRDNRGDHTKGRQQLCIKPTGFLVFEVNLPLNRGDTDRDGDLKSRLLIFEVNLALNRGDTDRDGDLKSLVFEIFDRLFLGDREFFLWYLFDRL